MADNKKRKDEVLGFVDAIISMLELVDAMDKGFNANVALNPFEYLFAIIKKTKYEDALEWLVNTIILRLPVLEMGIKGILLSNLKSTIDCNNDPRIPDWIRQDPFLGSSTSNNDKKGIMFSIGCLDYNRMLSVSPLAKEGRNLYFGVSTYFVLEYDNGTKEKFPTYLKAMDRASELGLSMVNGTAEVYEECEVDNVYQLARATDFNAFLWYVVHKSNLPAPLLTIGDSEDVGYVTGSTADMSVIPGNTVSGRTGIYVCTKSRAIVDGNEPDGDFSKEYRESENDDINKYEKTDKRNEGIYNVYRKKRYNYEFMRVSSDLNSANWYVNRDTYFNFMKTEGSETPRDYTKDTPICNLRYYNEYKGDDKYGEVGFDKLNLTILPKPFVHIPRLGEPPWRVQRILFDRTGKPDKKGNYTVKPVDPIGVGDNVQHKYQLDGSGNALIVNKKTGKYWLQGQDYERFLFECYQGLTVYEFNYDFVMGMRLFDPVTLTSQLINMVSGLAARGGYLGANIRLNKSESFYQMRISEIVKKIVESTAFEVSDCFYSFSNDEYDAMLKKSEDRRANEYPFSDADNKASRIDYDEINEILSHYSSKATLNENKEVIKRAINKVTANITEEVLPEDKYNIQVNFIMDMIRGMVNVIVESLLSPKIVILLETNRRLMGDLLEKVSIEDFLDSISGLIVSIVREIRDLILEELLLWVLDILTELSKELAKLLTLEQMEYYSRLMSQLIRTCALFRFGRRRRSLDTQLDDVDYADIDEIERPITDEC